tara:strand:- start:249 stop:539 length:291 start_codon:yes stop_codon:yes gene_type:complete
VHFYVKKNTKGLHNRENSCTIQYMKTLNPIELAVTIIKRSVLARALGLTPPAIKKWEKAGKMPRTEWTGETNYAAQMQKLSGGLVLKKDLLKIKKA